MWTIMLAASLLVATAQAPAVDEALPGRAILANIDRLGAYSVEFTRSEESLIKSDKSPTGEITIRQVAAPAATVKACSWKEDMRDLRCHYHEEGPDRASKDVRYDGEDDYRNVAGDGYVRESRGPGRDGEPRDLHSRRFARDLRRKTNRLFVPLDLLFPRDGGPPRFLSPHVEFGTDGVDPGTAIVRFARSASEPVDVRGIKTLQYDRQTGTWSPKDPARYKQVGAKGLRPDEWQFTPKHVMDRWWLDPDHGYLPVRVDVFDLRAGRHVVHRTEVLEFRQLAPDTWFPTRGIITFFDQVGHFSSVEEMSRIKDDPALVPVLRVTIAVTRISHGLSPANDDFRPPPGEQIHATSAPR